ncbi:hypothetical protein Sjap_018134 [Stephania japonica]|uniref:Transposase n=1 Tax=Stephania japonica TaxID=461633 RepID=A0AAP0I7H0_9MAGN
MSLPSLFGPDDPTTLQAYSSLLASQLPPPIAGPVTSKGSTHASPSHQQDYQHVPIASFDSSMHASPSTSHDHVEHASHSPNTSSHPSSEPSISGASRRPQRGDESARAPRHRCNDDRGTRRVFLIVKTVKEFGTFLHPSSEASKQITRVYKFDLHKDGYCWKTVPNHIKEQYFNKWATHFDWKQSDDAMVRHLYDRQIVTRYVDYVSKMVKKPTKPAHVSLEVFEHYKKMRSTPEYKAKSAQVSRNQRSKVGGPGSGPSVHGGGSISIYEHSLRLEKKLSRKLTALDLCFYLHTKDHDGVTFLDPRAEAIATAIHERTRELSQLQPDTSIDETKLYLEIVQRNDKGRRLVLAGHRQGL